MVKIVEGLRPQQLHDVVVTFGFGRRTGVELPGELRGQLHPVESWSGLTQASLAFGYEIGVTALQMAQAIATVANDGLQFPPRIVLEIHDPVGGARVVPSREPVQVISRRTARDLGFMLEQAVLDGTGRRAAMPGYRIAGKSGTTRKLVGGSYSNQRHVASFGGYGPVEDPRLVVFVVIDAPRGDQFGGQVAAPVFRRIMTDALPYLRVPASDEPRWTRGPVEISRRPSSGDAATTRRPTSNRADRVPDVTGLSLRESVARLAAVGFRAEISGTGLVIRQRPAAGTSAARGDVVRLSLEERDAATPAVWGGGR